jgi:hypothetical protein
VKLVQKAGLVAGVALVSGLVVAALAALAAQVVESALEESDLWEDLDSDLE